MPKTKPFKKILIHNRGEIAVCVIRARRIPGLAAAAAWATSRRALTACVSFARGYNDFSAQTVERFRIVSTAFSITCTGTHSILLWNASPPAKRFGVGSPM